MKKELRNRHEVPAHETWDLTHIVKDDAAWNELYQYCQNEISRLATLESGILDSADSIYEFLTARDNLKVEFMKVYGYAHMSWHQDTSDSAKQELALKANSLEAALNSALAFVEPMLSSCPQEKIETYLKQNPKLELYRHYFDNLYRCKPYILSKEQEELLAMASDVTSNIETTFAMFNNADIRFKPIENEKGETVELTHGNYIHFMESANREVRKNAFQSMYAAYKGNINTLASIYNMNLRSHYFKAKARGFQSTCEAALFENNIDVAIYDSLIENIHEYLPLFHRYLALRKKMLKLDSLSMYDIYVPLLPNVSEEISYEKAKETVLKSMAPMGEKYVNTVKKAFDNRWIDVYENRGKRSGAYSWAVYGVHPYILLNYSGNLNNVFTLTHELGHTMHSYLSNESQAFINHDYCIFLAEIASTCNENLLTDYLLKNTEDNHLKLAYINHFLEGFRATVFRQTMFAEFERLSHELVEKGEAITTDKLCDLYFELNKKYHGPDVEYDEEIRYEWARIPHFYYNYYVFQYATGLISSVAIADMIIKDGQSAVDRYTKEFLSAGSSKYPLDILKATGVDITDKEPTVRAMKVFETMLDDMEKLLQEMNLL